MRRFAGIGVLLLVAVMGGCTPREAAADQLTIAFRYSRFEPGHLSVKAGVPITITLRNDDPIEHEWIVGPPSVHQAHRTGTEAMHDSLPTEVTVPPYASRTTVVTFDASGALAYICHLPGHEAYGMSGMLTVLR